MKKIAGMFLILTAVAGYALAGVVAPEIDPASGAAALGIVAGAVLIVRGRRRA